MKRVTVPVTTDGSGNATAYSGHTKGLVHSAHYVPDGTNPFAATADFAITVEDTGEGIWTESNITAAAIRKPRAPTHTQVGVAATLDGTVAALDKIGLSSDRIKIVVAQGGANKSGTFIFLLEDE